MILTHIWKKYDCLTRKTNLTSDLIKEVITMFRQPISRNEMERLRDDMDRLFESAFSKRQRQRMREFPPINVWTNKHEGTIVTAELPGVDPDHLNISVTADTLTLSGSRQPAEVSDSVQYHRKERPRGEFNRSFKLPYTVNSQAVEANLDKGVLTITLPRAEAEKPKQIKVYAN